MIIVITNNTHFKQNKIIDFCTLSRPIWIVIIITKSIFHNITTTLTVLVM